MLYVQTILLMNQLLRQWGQIRITYWEAFIQSNLDSSNTDGFFTMANSNSFLSPNEVLPITQGNKYLGKFSYSIVKFYVVCTHLNRLIEAILMSTLNIQLLCRKSKKKIPKLSPFASWLGIIINPQWLEPPMSRTIFYGPKDVRAIEVRLYLKETMVVYFDTLHRAFGTLNSTFFCLLMMSF